MPFGRKRKKSIFLNLLSIFRSFFIFSRTKKYISVSLKRIKGSPQELSMGLATGLAVSFTPFIGLHALIAIFISWIIGASMATAIIGTFFGNPWTFPFIWYLTYEVGQLINNGIFVDYKEFSFKNIKNEITTLLAILKNVFIFANINEIKISFENLKLVPFMFIGSIPLVLLSWIISYLIFLNIFKSYKKTIMNKRKL